MDTADLLIFLVVCIADICVLWALRHHRARRLAGERAVRAVRIGLARVAGPEAPASSVIPLV